MNKTFQFWIIPHGSSFIKTTTFSWLKSNTLGEKKKPKTRRSKFLTFTCMCHRIFNGSGRSAHSKASLRNTHSSELPVHCAAASPWCPTDSQSSSPARDQRQQPSLIHLQHIYVTKSTLVQNISAVTAFQFTTSRFGMIIKLLTANIIVKFEFIFCLPQTPSKVNINLSDYYGLQFKSRKTITLFQHKSYDE